MQGLLDWSHGLPLHAPEAACGFAYAKRGPKRISDRDDR